MLARSLLTGLLTLSGEGLPPAPTAAQTWTIVGSVPDARFGRTTAVSDDIVFIGAPKDGAHGRAFRYQLQGGRYVLLDEIVASDPLALDNFGDDIDVDGAWVAIGAPPDDNLDAGGAVVVFERVDGALVERAVLTPVGESKGHFFGTNLDLDGDTLVVSRSLTPEVYVLEGGAWTLQATLMSTTPGTSTFSALALSGDTIIVGDAFADVDMYENCGRATVFVREGDVWSEQAVLTPEKLGYDYRYGAAVGLDGDVAAVARGYSGAQVEIFERAGDTWTRTAAFSPGFSGTKFFGDKALLRGDRLIVVDGGSLNSSGTSGYFLRTGGEWTTQTILPGAHAIGLSGDTLALGRPTDGPDEEGEVVIVELVGGLLGAACSDNAECLSGHCADGVCCDDHCLGECDVCSVAAGAEQDGACYRRPAPECCTENSQCSDSSPCTLTYCSADNVCVAENTCCSADDECVSEDPCYVGACGADSKCNYALLESCETGTDTGGETGADSTAGTSSGGGSSGSGDADAGTGDTAGADQDSGCGCRQGSGAPALPLMVVALVAMRRRRG
ncbi:MAG: FG-GAP repeat protein [Nannocystaceae bacterium]